MLVKDPKAAAEPLAAWSNRALEIGTMDNAEIAVYCSTIQCSKAQSAFPAHWTTFMLT